MALTTIQAVYDEARTALETGKDERAIGLSEHLLASFPHYLEAYRILGEAHLNRRELDEAAAAFQRVLRADPDGVLLGELRARGAHVSSAARGTFDIIFHPAPDRRALAALPSLVPMMKPAGALWVVRPKGQPSITEAETMRAGRSAGLVDVKVVSFSETHTAEKFVIPVARRAGARRRALNG